MILTVCLIEKLDSKTIDELSNVVYVFSYHCGHNYVGSASKPGFPKGGRF